MSKYDNLRTKYLNATFDSFVNSARYLTEYFEGEERDAQLDKLKVLMQDCCQNESVYTATNATFSEIQNEIQKRKSKQTRRTRNEDNESMEEDKEENDKPINIRQEFEKKMTEKLANAPNPKKNPKYVDFVKRIKTLTAEGDDELVITEQQVNTIDPISQQRMVNPVRIKQCGHTFERNSITCLLKKKPHIRCPMPGCKESRVTVGDLEDDPELKRILATM